MSYVAVLNDQIPILGTRLPYIKKYMKMHTLLAQTYLKFLKGKKVLKSQLIKNLFPSGKFHFSMICAVAHS